MDWWSGRVCDFCPESLVECSAPLSISRIAGQDSTQRAERAVGLLQFASHQKTGIPKKNAEGFLFALISQRLGCSQEIGIFHGLTIVPGLYANR
jgi:hypothetical protein